MKYPVLMVALACLVAPAQATVQRTDSASDVIQARETPSPFPDMERLIRRFTAAEQTDERLRLLESLDVRERWGRGGLLQLGPLLTIALQDESPAIVPKVTELILNTGDRVDPDPYENPADRIAMLRLEQALLQRANDRMPAVRQRIALALGRCRPEVARQPLLEMLKSGNPGVRLSAGVAFGGLGDKQAVPELIEALDADAAKNMPSSRGLIEALGRLKDSRAVDVLIAFLGSDNPELRRAACGALYHISSPKAIAPLKEVLACERDDRVIELATFALREIANK